MAENLITNGDFATGDFTGWDEHTTPGTSIVANACQFDHTGATLFLGQDFGAVVSKYYRLEYEVTANTGVDLGELGLSTVSVFGSILLSPSIGVHIYSLLATNTSPTLDIRFFTNMSTGGDTITIDNISVTETSDRGRSRYDDNGYRSRYN